MTTPAHKTGRTGEQPAFPVSIPGCGDNGWSGMSLLDYFAGQALLGILSGPASRDGASMKEWFDAPEAAYRLASKMIEVRAALSATRTTGDQS